MLSRVLFGLAALSSVLFSSVVADPPTYCSPVTIDAFAVVASSSGDSEGSLLAMANGTYPTMVYTVPLAQPYNNASIFFNIILTPNVTAANYQGLQTYGFTISLNGITKNSSAGNSFFAVSGTGAVNNVEFTSGWIFSPQGRATVNNVILNVTEVILIPNNITGLVAPGDLTECNYFYEFIFLNPAVTPGQGANVVGDPQFKGLRGQSFQVHGVDGAVYNLISDADQQLNTRFTFLEGPRPCPVMPSTGKVSAACWSHPGSYLSELALKTSGGSQLLIVSGEASQGFASVQLDGKDIAIGSVSKLAYTSASGSISVENTHELTIRSGLFELVVENNDGFLNLRSVAVSAANWPKLAAHGLLGQTWQNKRYGGKIKEIEGDVDDYLIEDDNMFGDAFLFNKFAL